MDGEFAMGDLSDFECGGLTVRPRERLIQSSRAAVSVEPLVMQLLVALASRAGQLVSRRELFELCWGNAVVGDDSLNRIIAALRRVLKQAGDGTLAIETVPATGYVLRLPATPTLDRQVDPKAEVLSAIDAASDSWRLGLPHPDFLCMEKLRRACLLQPADAKCWGMLALLCRHAAEYGSPKTVSQFVRECEAAARQAIRIDPLQPDARVAMLSVIPLFGCWTEARRGLEEILAIEPSSAVALQDLATLEMATGRVRRSMELRDKLVSRDPLAACHCYKAVYQHWSAGDLTGMDHIADRALALWPRHPAVWNVRLWTLAYTDRIPAALAMLSPTAAKPAMPTATHQFLRSVLGAVQDGTPAAFGQAIEMSVRAAGTGPTSAIAALFALGLIGDHDQAFAIVNSYYLSGGSSPVPLQHCDAEMSLNEHHRRLTQILFTPVFDRMRSEARFVAICDRIGLSRYWEENNLEPDYLATG